MAPLLARQLNRLIPVCFALVAVAGCGTDGPSNPVSPGGTSGGRPASASYSGAFVSGSSYGSVSFTISFAKRAATTQNRSQSYPVTGSLKPDGGAAISLSGEYNTLNGALTISNPDYAFSGTHAIVDGNEVIDGTWSTASGPGWFGVSQAAAHHLVAAYCGTWEYQSGLTAGPLALIRTDEHLRGMMYTTTGTGHAVNGTVGTGTGTLSASFHVQEGFAYILNAAGNLNESTQAMDGTWTRLINLDSGGNGTWHAEAPAP